jgi:hypothetical protein
VPSFPWLFPYTEDVVSRTSAVTDRTILRPAMTVTMVGREEQSVLALVDSGSEHTLSGMGLARLIDAQPDPDRELVLGVGGAWRKARFTEITHRISQAFALEAVDEFDRRFGVQIERGQA